MALEAKDLIGPITNAVKPVLGKYWSDVREYAVSEGEKMAKTLATITALHVSKKINDQQAQVLLDMQKHSMQVVLLANEGIGAAAAQSAINAGLGAVKDVVNKAIGFALL